MPKNKNDDKRILIIRTAKKVFGKTGEGPKTSIKEVARLTEMSTSGLYTYFSSKEDLIQAIIERDWNWALKEMAGAPQGEEAVPNEAVSSEAVLKALTATVLPELLSDTDLVSLIVRYPQAISDPEAKLAGLIGSIDPALKAVRERNGKIPLDAGARRAQCAILVLGALAAAHFNANSSLRFSVKDILDGFRGFLS